MGTGIMSWILVLACLRAGACNYLFISMSPQLYIPGQRYSMLTMSYNIGPMQYK